MRWGVSIHAPWEGCDSSLLTSAKSVLKFQFTHPGKGATSTKTGGWSPKRRFNSRTLGRVRRSASISDRILFLFQFTHPGKGATQALAPRRVRRGGFNSRTLGRVRLFWSPAHRGVATVSIHAPWEGCDYLCVLPPLSPILFQFTHPGKGATVIFDSFMSM